MKPSNYTGEISIEQVLAEISANSGKPFTIEFVRSSGKECGTIKIVSRALYGRAEASTLPKPRIGASNRQQSLHIYKGTIPLQDYTTGQYITPLISHIIGYQLKKVKH